MSDVLGCGHFGVVHFGTWTDGSADPIQVAVKTLNLESSESDRVKFLSVVQLHGVVTEEQNNNMMIVLEYMSKGDLQKYLLSLQNKYKQK